MSQLPVPLPPRAATPEGAGAERDFGMDGMPMRFGKYTLIRKLATGGMAELFLAIQKSVAGFEKLLVIKRILPAMNQDRAFIEMLLHEARIAATLSHPNIVQIFDVGHGGRPVLHRDGARPRRGPALDRPADEEEGRRRVPARARPRDRPRHVPGLLYAHDKRDLDGTHLSIVHRDISPQNIVVTFTGDVKIVDFGIAKSDTRTGEQTKSGKLKGKVPYMSPEQARGEVIDARSDLFATGTMLFELTTGKRLFKGQSEYETLKLICDREYPRPSEINPDYPPDLEAIVMRALAKDPTDRYQSAREMQGDLEAFVRRHQIAVSSLALNQFMQSLFEEKLAMQKEALLQGKHLADIIELQHAHVSNPDVSGGFDVDGSGQRVASTQSMPAAARTVTDVSANRPPKASGTVIAGLVAAVLVVAGALGGAGYVLAKKNNEATDSPATTAPSIAKGSLVVTSEPIGASIWINGDLRPEVTPATIKELPTGVALDVKLTMDGFEHAKQKVTLEDGQSSDVKVELKKGSVIADVKVSPDGLTPTFAIDGKPVTGPRIEGVTSSVSHKLTVTAPGFGEGSVTFTGSPLETKHLEITLEKLPEPRHGGAVPAVRPATTAPQPAGNGKLNVGASGGWCNVTVDGAARGATPVAGLELPAGPHKISCTTPDGKVRDATVTVPAGDTARYKFTL